MDIKAASISSVQFNSVAQSGPTLCDPMNRSTPGLPVHHQLHVLAIVNSAAMNTGVHVSVIVYRFLMKAILPGLWWYLIVVWFAFL